MPGVLKVAKRGGGFERFSSKKLESSVEKALGYKKMDVKLAKMITREVKRRLSKRHTTQPVPVEEVKQVTYKVMVEMKLKHVARYYLIYRYL